MAESGGEKLLLFGLIGAAAWWVYNNYFSAQVSSAADGPGSGAASPAPGGAGANGGVVTTAKTLAPTISLAALEASFRAAVLSAAGSDTELVCQQSAGLSGLGLPVGSGTTAPTAGRVGYQTDPNAGGMASRPVGSPARPSGVDQPACVTYAATYDVFNWYLANRSGLPAGLTPPVPPDHTSTVTIDQYLGWVSPLLQSQVKGLAGVGRAGLGHIAAITALVRRSA